MTISTSPSTTLWRNRRFRSIVAGACALVLVSGCGRDEPPPPSLPTSRAVSPEEAATAVKDLMALTLSDHTGAMHPLKQWEGKVLVINYWATWCAPCKEEMPAFARIFSKYSSNGVQFIGISSDSPDEIKTFLGATTATPINYPLLLGKIDVMQTSAKLGNAVQALPFTVILDREGKIYASKLGRLSEETLERHLKTLLKQ